MRFVLVALAPVFSLVLVAGFRPVSRHQRWNRHPSPRHLLRLSPATQTATQDVIADRVIPTNRLLFRHSTATITTIIDATTSTDAANRAAARRSIEGSGTRKAQEEVQCNATAMVIITRVRRRRRSQRRLSRATVVMPSGAGKTVVDLRVFEALEKGSGLRAALVLLPTLDLVSQTTREWRRWPDPAATSKSWEALAVCSRLDVDGMARTTDPEEIAAFLRAGVGETVGPGSGARVLFCTYHSGEKVAKAQALLTCEATGGHTARPLRLDLVICDEAHREPTSASGYSCSGEGGLCPLHESQPKDKRCSRPLFDADLAATRRLLLTATPRLYDARRSLRKQGGGGDDDDGGGDDNDGATAVVLRWTTRARTA